MTIKAGHRVRVPDSEFCGTVERIREDDFVLVRPDDGGEPVAVHRSGVEPLDTDEASGTSPASPPSS